jgi:hypothetical protein
MSLKSRLRRADVEPVVRRLIPAALLVGAIAALSAAPAVAASEPSATINVCDSPGAPNMVGVRAQMPGGRKRDQMYVTIQPEWFSRARQQWLPAGGSVELYLGKGAVRSRQGGYTFEYDQPAPGRGYPMRGTVGFQWRRGGDVVRSATAVTSDGMPGVLEGMPSGLSAGICGLR